jgi:hypothetical protein
MGENDSKTTTNAMGNNSLKLRIETGPDTGKEFLIDKMSRIGRTSLAEIVLNDPMVSENHAILYPQGEKFAISNLEGLTGTVVNGQRLQSSRYLEPGDTISLGDTTLRVISCQGILRKNSFCIRCGAAAGNGNFCIACGASLSVPLPPPPAIFPPPLPEPPAPVATPRQNHCPKCGAVVGEAAFCTACGTAMTMTPPPLPPVIPLPHVPLPEPSAEVASPPPNTCLKCGAVVRETAFCTACGTALTQLSSAPDILPPPVLIPELAAPVATPPQNTCPKCRAVVGEAAFCTACGTAIAPPPPVGSLAASAKPVREDFQPAPVSASSSAFCTQCGAASRGERFCQACGADLVRSGTTQPVPDLSPPSAPSSAMSEVPRKIPNLPVSSSTEGSVSSSPQGPVPAQLPTVAEPITQSTPVLPQIKQFGATTSPGGKKSKKLLGTIGVAAVLLFAAAALWWWWGNRRVDYHVADIPESDVIWEELPADVPPSEKAKAQLEQGISGIEAAFQTGELNQAMELVHPAVRSQYESIFKNKPERIRQTATILATRKLVVLSGNVAEYEITDKGRTYPLTLEMAGGKWLLTGL